MAIFEDGVYAVKNGDMYKITLPEPAFKGAKTIKLQLRPETNAERIRSMSDGELARFLQGVTLGLKTPLTDWVDWLRQEAVDNGTCLANETSEKVQGEE